MTLAAAVTKLRYRHNLEQQDIVNRTGLSKGHVSQIVNGHRENASLSTLRKLASIFGLKLSTFCKMLD